MINMLSNRLAIAVLLGLGAAAIVSRWEKAERPEWAAAHLKKKVHKRKASKAVASKPEIQPAPIVVPATVTPPIAPDPATRAAAVPLAAAIPAAAKLTPAKELFGAVKEPAKLATRSIGFYAKGCLAGGQPLPVNGPAWQAMRLSRNRNWGHPSLVKFIERFANDAKEKDGWPGLLVGDMSQPRGGPMTFGHTSHQVGLDVDIWYRAMPDHELSPQERESTPLESFLADPAHVNPKMWTEDHEKLLRRATSYPEVARVFVNPAIKKWLCENVKGDRKFMHKIMAIGGHDDHFHVRLVCPPDNAGCQNQPALPDNDGCGKGLDKWVAQLSRPTVPLAPPAPKTAAAVVAKPSKSKPPTTMNDLPTECRAVLSAAPEPISR